MASAMRCRARPARSDGAADPAGRGAARRGVRSARRRRGTATTSRRCGPRPSIRQAAGGRPLPSIRQAAGSRPHPAAGRSRATPTPPPTVAPAGVSAPGSGPIVAHDLLPDPSVNVTADLRRDVLLAVSHTPEPCRPHPRHDLVQDLAREQGAQLVQGLVPGPSHTTASSASCSGVSRMSSLPPLPAVDSGGCRRPPLIAVPGDGRGRESGQAWSVRSRCPRPGGPRRARPATGRVGTTAAVRRDGMPVHSLG